MKIIQKYSIIIVFITLFIILFSTEIFAISNNSFSINKSNIEITINFAGNLSDFGGPYWRPPGEDDALDEPSEGTFRDGYYTNDSRQHEDWMYINISVTGEPNEVWLHWFDRTDNFWINNTFQFINTINDFWEFNISNNITNIISGHDYSFDIYAQDLQGNSNTVKWEKVGLYGQITRRFVQFGYEQEVITYKPFYLYKKTPETGQYTVPVRSQHDRLHHDQGPADTETDTGYLNSTIPGDRIEKRSCMIVTAYYFEDNVCIKPFFLKNVYFHFWYGTTKDGLSGVYIGKSRKAPGGILSRYDPPDKNFSLSNISSGTGKKYLEAHLLKINPDVWPQLTDNNIYESVVMFTHVNASGGSSLISIRTVSNRSFMSFVLFNVPDNNTLNASYIDSDKDALSDWTELYVTYTSPFFSDTDNDGATDYEEINGKFHGYNSTDPNNFTDTTSYKKKIDIKINNPKVRLINSSIHFSCNISGGQPPYSYQWDFGDGATSNESAPNHIYSKNKSYVITLTVTDSLGNWDYNISSILIKNFNLGLLKPERALYIKNIKIFPFKYLIKKPIIIGEIEIEPDSNDNELSKLEFYIDDKLKYTDYEKPFIWTWKEKCFSEYSIKLIAYDIYGNNVTYEQKVWKFF